MLPDPAGVVLGPKDGGMVLVGGLVRATDDGGKDLGSLKGHFDDMLIAEHLGGASGVAVKEKDIHGITRRSLAGQAGLESHKWSTSFWLRFGRGRASGR